MIHALLNIVGAVVLIWINAYFAIASLEADRPLAGAFNIAVCLVLTALLAAVLVMEQS